MHICCANCCLYPLKTFLSRGIDIKGLWFNPNIHPYTEYRKRLETVKEFSLRAGLDVVYRDGYDLDAFLSRVVGAGANRCEQCYRMRLNAAGAAAREQGFDVLTTSLLYSKYQKHDLIRGIATEMAREHGVEFYYEDFRRGWREGIMESKAMGLYRQQYCGCIYSEWERYRGTDK